MINYYYEIVDTDQIKYFARYNVHPLSYSYPWALHEDLIKKSNRVWLENANGVAQIKGPDNSNFLSEKALTWLKLVSKELDVNER